MKIRDLKDVVFDKIVIYKDNPSQSINEPFIDIYKGDISDVPFYLLDVKIGSIGAKRKGVLDIKIDTL